MIEKIYDAVDENLHPFFSTIEEELENHGCNLKTQMLISVMVEEIFINIAHYAYDDFVGKATILIDFENDDVLITFIDEGKEFNPLAKEDPDISLNAENREIGGLGIYMVKKSMDDVTYKREDNKNILTIRKRIH